MDDKIEELKQENQELYEKYKLMTEIKDKLEEQLEDQTYQE